MPSFQTFLWVQRIQQQTKVSCIMKMLVKDLTTTSIHSRSSTNVVFFITLIRNLILIWGHCLCGVYKFSPYLCGFSVGTPVSSPTLKMCTWGELACLSFPSVSKCGCLLVVLGWKGILSKVGSHLPPWAAQTGSSHLWPSSKISRLRNNYFTVSILLS